VPQTRAAPKPAPRSAAPGDSHEESAEYSSVATGDFEIVQTRMAVRPPGESIEDEAENLATGDFESFEPKPKK
jgi:hypothetical protein